MELQLLKTFLLWNLSISNLVIIVWFAAFVFTHEGIYRSRPETYRTHALLCSYGIA
jgi:hypothetical protein